MPVSYVMKLTTALDFWLPYHSTGSEQSAYQQAFIKFLLCARPCARDRTTEVTQALPSRSLYAILLIVYYND